MKQLDENLAREMTDRLVMEFDPEQVILFGSYAWGTPSEDSDIDLFVIVPQSNERPLQRARRACGCLAGMRVAKDVPCEPAPRLKNTGTYMPRWKVRFVKRGGSSMSGTKVELTGGSLVKAQHAFVARLLPQRSRP